MKVFISHSWKDKSQATTLYEAMQSDGHHVWYDIHQLMPGDNIQEVIDVYIAKCEVVVLLWSLNAFASDGVEAEILTAKRLGKRIIPILADSTPLHHSPELKGLLGIPLEPQDTGLLLLRRALVLLSASEADKEASWFKETFGNITELGGYLNYVNTYRLQQGQNDADGQKEAWAQRIEKLAEKNEQIRQEVLPDMNDKMDRLKQIMHELEHGSPTPQQLEEWQQWCTQHRDFHPDMMDKLATFISKERERLQAGGQPARQLDYVAIEQVAAHLEYAIGQTQEAAAEKMAAKIRKYGGFLLGEKNIQSMVKGYLNYVIMCPLLLRQLAAQAQQSPHAAVREALHELHQVLQAKERGPLAPNAILEHFFGDAYLINNTVQALLDAKLVQASELSYDVAAVNIVNTYVTFAVSAEERTRLDGIIQRVKQAIGQKKDEINWGMAIGALAALGGLAALVGGDVSAAGDTAPPADGLEGGSFEDKIANFSAHHGGGLTNYL